MDNFLAKKTVILMICGLVGCVCMGASDWLMIFGDATYEGELAWLTVGVSQMEPWRTSVALFFAFPAVVFYAIGLFGIKNFISDEVAKRRYSALTVVGMTPWLCLHLFYVMILFLFGWMTAQGHADLAFSACEALFAQFSWIVIVGEIFMGAPFIYLLVITAQEKTVFPRWMLLNNPIIIMVVLKFVAVSMGTTAFGLAFTNGLMSESMFVWFAVYAGYAWTHKNIFVTNW